LEKLRAKVAELFPTPEQADLRQEIERTFNDPQYGEYHNEGILMDTHFEAILNTLENIGKGIFPTELEDQEVKYAMQDIVLRYHDEMQKYVFLHDISKIDLLRTEVKSFEGESRIW